MDNVISENVCIVKCMVNGESTLMRFYTDVPAGNFSRSSGNHIRIRLNRNKCVSCRYTILYIAPRFARAKMASDKYSESELYVEWMFWIWCLTTNTFLIIHAFKLIILNIMAQGNLSIIKMSHSSSAIPMEVWHMGV